MGLAHREQCWQVVEFFDFFRHPHTVPAHQEVLTVREQNHHQTSLQEEKTETREPAARPDEFGLVGVVQRHQQLGVFPDVTDEVLQVHEQAVGVHCAEQALAPHLQVLKPHLRGTQAALTKTRGREA